MYCRPILLVYLTGKMYQDGGTGSTIRRCWNQPWLVLKIVSLPSGRVRAEGAAVISQLRHIRGRFPPDFRQVLAAVDGPDRVARPVRRRPVRVPPDPRQRPEQQAEDSDDDQDDTHGVQVQPEQGNRAHGEPQDRAGRDQADTGANADRAPQAGRPPAGLARRPGGRAHRSAGHAVRTIQAIMPIVGS